MEINFYKPKNDILKKYIESYYFISDNVNYWGIPFRYWTFPNNYSIVSVSLNTDVVFQDRRITIIPSLHKNISADVVFRYILPIEIYYEKPVNEITIYFKPLGLNYFINNFKDLLLQNNMKIFNPFPDFENKMERILNLSDRKIQIQELEKYWLSKLLVKDLSLIKNILTEVETDSRIEDIAKTYCLSRQHLSKIFRENLGKPPSEYKKIHRFRNSIEKKQMLKNLTELSHENLFYDQSHFIKDFRDLTKLNPNVFFKSVDTYKDNIWLII